MLYPMSSHSFPLSVFLENTNLVWAIQSTAFATQVRLSGMTIFTELTSDRSPFKRLTRLIYDSNGTSSHMGLYEALYTDSQSQSMGVQSPLYV